MRSSRFITVCSFAIVAFCLAQVWLPSHYLTCDGPCHLYNARILHDTWTGVNSDFYGRFYHVSYTTDPNATTTYLLAFLLFLFKGAVAEKVFLSIYIVILSAGGIRLLQKLQGGSNLWQLATVSVIFTFLLSKGFYNFSLGLALWPWMVAAWISYLELRKVRPALIFAAVSALTYFTHLLPFLSAAVVCGCLTISYSLAATSDTPGVKPMTKNLAVLAGALMPFVLLSLLFTNSEGGLNLQLAPHPYRLLEMLELKYLINVTEGEKPWALASGIILALTAVAAVWTIRKRGIHKYDGFILSLLPIGFVYLFFPEDFMGRAIIIAARVQLVLFMLAACIIAYRVESAKIRQVAAALLLLCFGALSVIRMACRHDAAGALRTYLELGSSIEPESIVLPLELSENGIDENGRLIADRNSLFHHASHYLAADKPLIMLDNYEANAGYFPVSWLPAVNPYHHLGRGRGIEGMPPAGDIAGYEQTTHRAIDYVLLSGYEPHFLSDTGFNRLARQVDSLFSERKTTGNGRNLLFSHD